MATYNGYNILDPDLYVGDIINYQGPTVSNTVVALSPKKLIIRKPGSYRFTLWGSPNSNTNYPTTLAQQPWPGKVVGTLSVDFPLSLYVMVGNSTTMDTTLTGKGYVNTSTLEDLSGLYYTNNGGGVGGLSSATPSNLNNGGGATDIRLSVNGTEQWYEEESLRSRILIAGGASGSVGYTLTNVAPTQSNSSSIPNGITNTNKYTGGPGTQTGFTAKTSITYRANVAIPQLCRGGTARRRGSNGRNAFGGAAGYWGGEAGGASGTTNTTQGAGGGASMFISGHPSCIALNRDGSSSGQPIHYSGLEFTDYSFVTNAQDSPVGLTTKVGYARIEVLELYTDGYNKFLVEDYGILKTFSGGDWVSIPGQ